MAEQEPDTATEPKKSSKLPLIIGLVLALVGAGAGFFAVSSGIILASESDGHAADEVKNDAVPDIAFVPVDPLVISLLAPSQSRHLRFRAELEVPAEFQGEVEKLLPRVVDVLNSYLRALDMGALEEPSALMRLRAQMLRRVQVVTGQGRVNDLLIMEFVLN